MRFSVFRMYFTIDHYEEWLTKRHFKPLREFLYSLTKDNKYLTSDYQ